MKNTIFVEKTFAECLLLSCQRMPCPQILWRKLSRIATKMWNLWKFSPSKVSHYKVFWKSPVRFPASTHSCSVWKSMQTPEMAFTSLLAWNIDAILYKVLWLFSQHNYYSITQDSKFPPIQYSRVSLDCIIQRHELASSHMISHDLSSSQAFPGLQFLIVVISHDLTWSQ